MMLVMGLAAFTPLDAAPTPSPKAVPAAPQDDFTAGQRWFKKNDFAKAAAAYAQFAKTQPNDPRAATAWLQEGLCKLRLNKSAEALRCWNWILQRYPASPDVPEALEQLIGLYEKRDQTSEASILSNRLLKQHPQHPATLRLLVRRADTSSASQRYEEVVRLLSPVRAQLTGEQARQLDLAQICVEAKTNPEKLLTAASAALEADEPAKAVPLLKTFLVQSGVTRTAEARTKLGWALYCSGDAKQIAEAEDLWKSVVNKGPSTDAWVGEAQWHMVQLLAGPKAKPNEAISLCEKIAQHQPQGTFRHEQALYTKAWLFWIQHDWKAALGAFNDLIKSYPSKASQPAIQRYVEECKKAAENNK